MKTEPELIFSRPRDGKGPQTEKSTNGKLFGRSVLGGQTGSINKDVYMIRYWFGNLRLHIMHRGDSGRTPHDHPWWFITFPLTSYVEEVLVEKIEPESGTRYLDKELNFVDAFRFHFRPARYAHRILGPYVRDRKRRKALFQGSVYWTNMTDDELRGLRESEPKLYARKMVTIVLRGRVKWSWGFYTDWKGTWVKAAEFFRRDGVSQ